MQKILHGYSRNNSSRLTFESENASSPAAMRRLPLPCEYHGGEGAEDEDDQ
jgi:hypothetical protein